MSAETKTTHITPVGGNVFADLGFAPDEAARLLAESRRKIAEELSKKECDGAQRRKYKLVELLAECDPSAPLPRVDGWDEMKPVGKEILD